MGVACAFLNYKESSTQTLENVLGAIVRQLAVQQDLQPARASYETHSKQGTSITLDEVQSLLAIYAQKYTQVYVILDALDEYFAEDRNQLLKIILAASGNFKLWITCRPQITPPEDLKCIRLEIQPPPDDIETYIISQIGHNDRLKSFTQNERVKNRIIKSISSKAAGMFLFVKLQMDLLSFALTEDRVLESLAELPQDLKSLYEKTLEQIKLKNPELRKLGLAALGWVAFAKRPLTVQELRAALAIPATKPLMPTEKSMVQCRDILEACQGLIIVTQAGDKEIAQLVHYTAQEFMNNIQSKEFANIHITIAKTLFVCLQWAADSKNFSESAYHDRNWLNIQPAHPLLEYTQHILSHITGKQTEIVLQADFLAGIQNFKRYPHWEIKPWNYENMGKPYSAMWLAVAGNLLYVVEDLLHCPQQVQQASATIAMAARYGYESMLKLLKARNVVMVKRDLDWALCAATLEGHKSCIEYLLSVGADVNGYHGTALQTAAAKGHENIVDILLQAHADPNLQGGRYGTALHAAAAEGHQAIVEILLHAKANPNCIREDYSKALQEAPSLENGNIIEFLLQVNADPNLIAEICAGGYAGGNSISLQQAEIRKIQNIIELLLRGNADLTVIAGEYVTALQAAAGRGYQSIVKVLLQAKANPNYIGGHYGTALQIAAAKGHQAIVLILLQALADPNLLGGKYGTALQAAAAEGHETIVKILLQAKANHNLRGGKYCTALQAAAAGGHETIVHILLQVALAHDKSIHMRLDANTDENLSGAIHAAIEGGHQAIADFLRQVEDACSCAPRAAATGELQTTLVIFQQKSHKQDKVAENFHFIAIRNLPEQPKLKEKRIPLVEARQIWVPDTIKPLLAYGTVINNVDSVAH